MLPAMGKLLWKPTGTMGLGVQAAHLSHCHPLTNTQNTGRASEVSRLGLANVTKK